MGKIITIGREFGSGGREVGKKLAEELSFAYYDKELVEKLATETGLDSNYIERQSEQYSATAFPYVVGRTFLSLNTITSQMSTSLHVAQNKLLKEIAQKENAVIIGRCADYILRDFDVLKVFVHASDSDYKIKRYAEREEDKEKTVKEIEKEIRRVDKHRASYYQQISGQKWADMSNYNLCIDTSKVGVDGAVAIILAAVNL